MLILVAWLTLYTVPLSLGEIQNMQQTKCAQDVHGTAHSKPTWISSQPTASTRSLEGDKGHCVVSGVSS